MDAWEAISKGISDDIVRDNRELNYKINELKRYVRFLEAKVEILEKGLADLGKGVGVGNDHLGEADDLLKPWY